MAKNTQQDLNGALEKETRETMAAQVENALSSTEQMNRVLINLFGELLEELKKVEHAVTAVNNAYILANKETILDRIKQKG